MDTVEKFAADERQRVRRKNLGCFLRLIIGAVIVVLVFRFILLPFFETGGGNADTREVPGDAGSFDPIAAYPEILAYAGEGAQLLSIDAYYVRSDGMMQLTAESYNPRITYEFVREVPAPADAPPVGAGGSGDQWYEPVEIEASKPGTWWSVRSGSLSYSYMNRGMERDTSSLTSSEQTIIAAPRCSFADLWTIALTRDAPSDAVAVIRYDEDGYEFSISDVGIYLQFSEDCKLVR